jgi:hypothetical protein
MFPLDYVHIKYATQDACLGFDMWWPMIGRYSKLLREQAIQVQQTENDAKLLPEESRIMLANLSLM